MKKEQIIKINEEIVENFFIAMKSIINSHQPRNVQIKMLYSSRYWAKYFMDVSNALINEHLQEKH